MATATTLSDPLVERDHLKRECSRLHSEVIHEQMTEERLRAEVLRLEADNDGLRAENARLKRQRSAVLAMLQSNGLGPS
jgi:hypothetical protein